MNSFVKKSATFLSPFIFLIVFYIINDPFKVIWKTNYQDSQISLNRHYLSTELLKRNYAKHEYDSFIFGNSRSGSFRCSDWEKYLPSGSNVFHYQADGEGIYAVYKKIAYLDRSGIKIKNALVIFDRYFFELTWELKEYRFIDHPDYSDYSIWEFQKVFLSTFFQGKFLLRYFFTLCSIDNRSSRRLRTPNSFDPINNDIAWAAEKQIAQDSISYYNHAKFNIEIETEMIKSLKLSNDYIKDITMYTNEIKKIFDKHKTNYRIIIVPIYGKFGIAPEIFDIIIKNFNKENVYNYSSIREYVLNKGAYFEPMHFRPWLGEKMMKSAYEQTTPEWKCKK